MMTAKKKTAGKTASGVPFAPGADPRRGQGRKGRSGRPKFEVRAVCLQGFEEAIPVLLKIVRGTLPDVSNADRIRAADVLARYAGLSYFEAEARVDARVAPATMRRYETPTNGREFVPRADTFIPANGTGNGGGMSTVVAAGYRGPERRRAPRTDDD